MTDDRRIENVTCLGCGCGCDDLTVVVSSGRITDVTPVCPLGRAWFGDGQVPARIISEGHSVSLDQALSRLADLLWQARGRCLVYIGADLTAQAQRAAVGIADILDAAVECDTSDTAAQGILTAQRRGRAGATLGEIRNRGDVFLFWGIDPRERYPRFLARYSLDPVGTHVPEGRKGRFVIGVSIGADQAVEPADTSLELAPDQEIAALSLIRAAVLGRPGIVDSPLAAQATQLAERLVHARYAVVVHDAEPTAEERNPLRTEALIALAQALNGPTRAALCSLRAGGNRVGAESVLTWQTGYPLAVEYSRGYPRYRPEWRGIAGLQSGRYSAVLVVGSAPAAPAIRAGFSGLQTAVIGPRASAAPFPAVVAVDTGVAGIHESGTGYRMDEVPLSLRPCLGGPPSTTDVLKALAGAVGSRPTRNP
jgi:formylmethanofuran dehydrogenase subunit B